MKKNLYALAAVITILAIVVGVVSLVQGIDRSSVFFALIFIAVVLRILGDLFGNRKKIKTRKVVVESISGVEEAFNKFYDLLGFDSKPNEEKPWVARIVGDLHIEVSEDGRWEGETTKYVLSELVKEVVNGHTYYYKTGAMGFFFFNDERETVMVYFV